MACYPVACKRLESTTSCLMGDRFYDVLFVGMLFDGMVSRGMSHDSMPSCRMCQVAMQQSEPIARGRGNMIQNRCEGKNNVFFTDYVYLFFTKIIMLHMPRSIAWPCNPQQSVI
jgi:hypothetical protein